MSKLKFLLILLNFIRMGQLLRRRIIHYGKPTQELTDVAYNYRTVSFTTW